MKRRRYTLELILLASLNTISSVAHSDSITEEWNPENTFQRYHHCQTFFENKERLYQQDSEWRKHLTLCVKQCKQLVHALKFKEAKKALGATALKHSPEITSQLKAECDQGYRFIIDAQEAQTSE